MPFRATTRGASCWREMARRSRPFPRHGEPSSLRATSVQSAWRCPALRVKLEIGRFRKNSLIASESEFVDLPKSALDDSRIRREFLDRREKAAGASRTREADNRLSVISRILTWAVERGHIAANHPRGFRNGTWREPEDSPKRRSPTSRTLREQNLQTNCKLASGRQKEREKSAATTIRWMARRKGFEPLTPRFEVWCSIQLSYRRGRGVAQRCL